MLISDDHAVADAVKNGLHELDLMLQFINGFLHFVLDPLCSETCFLGAALTEAGLAGHEDIRQEVLP